MLLIAYRAHETPAYLALMDTNNSITAAIFTAFLKCPTKAHLLAIGEPAPTAFFTNIEDRLSGRDYEAIARPVDCETTAYNVAPPSHEPRGCQSRESTPSSTFAPVL